MTRRAFFVDDQDEAFARLISTPDLNFDYLPVRKLTELSGEIFTSKPLIVALDYRLDEELKELTPEDTYKGSSLAQHLRDKAIEKPEHDLSIVLVSAEAKIRVLYDPDKTAHDLFDRVFRKEYVIANRTLVQRQLASLADAYEALRTSRRPYDIRTVMAARDDDHEVLSYQELELAVRNAAAPHLVVHRLLRAVIDRPGILLDDESASAVLGIKPNDFELVAPPLTAAEVGYRGLLASGWRRWWRHRLEEWAVQVFGDRPETLSARDRSKLLNERLGLQTSPARSPWNDSEEEPVILACSSCHRPVEMKHTLAAFDRNVPRFGMRRRICWDCVQKDDYLHSDPPLVVDQDDEEMVSTIKSLPRT